MILQISASQIARITGASHWHMASLVKIMKKLVEKLD
jgi:hypothetical protein